MKSMRIPLLAVMILVLVGLIFGSLFDLTISHNVATVGQPFGLAVSAVSPTIGFAGLCVIGGGFFALAKKEWYPTWAKVCFYILAAGIYGVSIYYAGVEYFGPNGFAGAAPKWAGFLIAAVPLAGGEVGGYFLFRNTENKRIWVLFLISLAILGVALVFGGMILKGIMHRPRYRFIVSHSDVNFHNWWQPFKVPAEYADAAFKEEFRSFPSGHTIEATILYVPVVFMGLSEKKLRKAQLPAFIGVTLFVILLAFCRILCGAHFLSDVSMGAFITLFLTYIANEVVINQKKLQLPEEAPQQE